VVACLSSKLNTLSSFPTPKKIPPNQKTVCFKLPRCQLYRQVASDRTKSAKQIPRGTTSPNCALKYRKQNLSFITGCKLLWQLWFVGVSAPLIMLQAYMRGFLSSPLEILIHAFSGPLLLPGPQIFSSFGSQLKCHVLRDLS
jgi:hypothetical protein